MATDGLLGCNECGHEWFTLHHVEIDGSKHIPSLCFDTEGHVAAWGGQLRCAACNTVHDGPPLSKAWKPTIVAPSNERAR